MKKLEFKIDIAASAKKVMDTMLGPETYKEWTKDAWPGSQYEGSWEKGEKIKFIAPGQGGTMAEIVEHRPNEYILAKHIGVIGKDGSVDKESEQAKGWIGTTEAYRFAEKNGKTQVSVEINTFPAWEKMFADDWPKALESLKRICEN